MNELIFTVEDELEGGYSASALGVGIHTQGDSLDELKEMIRDAITCYFDEEDKRPSVARLHFVHDELMAL